jgi:hypothetical protein
MSYWILQANPTIYDALAALSGPAEELDRWRVKRYLNELELGDEFALWISGRDSGVYAFGILTEAPVRERDPDPFWQDRAEGLRMDWRVGIRIEQRLLESPILRSDLLRIPGFARSAIIRMPGGGNPEVVPAFVELESGGPSPGAFRMVGHG